MQQVDPLILCILVHMKPDIANAAKQLICQESYEIQEQSQTILSLCI